MLQGDFLYSTAGKIPEAQGVYEPVSDLETPARPPESIFNLYKLIKT